MKRPVQRTLSILISLTLLLWVFTGCSMMNTQPDAYDDSDAYLYHAVQSLSEEMILESIESGADLNEEERGFFSSGYNPLSDAVNLGLEMRTLRMMLEQGADVNRLDSRGLSPLMRSCGAYSFDDYYSLDHTKLFLEFGGDPNVKSRSGMSALDFAVQNMDTERARLLMTKDCEVTGRTLQMAQDFFSGSTDCTVLRLLAEKMKKDGKETGMNQIEEAALLGNSQTFIQLTEEMQLYKSDTEALKRYVAAFCSPEALQTLINLEVDCPDALSIAAENGNTELVRSLIEQGANVNKADSNGYTPLYNAIYNRKYEAAALLLENGASLEDPTSETYDHGMNLATLAAGNGDAGMLKLLAEHGLYLNDSKRFDLIGYAMTEGGAGVIEFLLGGMNPEQYPDRLTEGLETACDYGYKDIAWLLIRKGADVNGINGQGAPLYYAVFRGYTDLAQLLIEQGAQINNLNKDYETNLMTAARYGYFDMVRLLVEKGGKVNLTGGDYEDSALTLAAQSSNRILGYLLKHGAYLNYQNADGDSALMLAVKARLSNNVILILQQNPDTALLNAQGMTAYDIARAERNETFAQLLMGTLKGDQV